MNILDLWEYKRLKWGARLIHLGLRVLPAGRVKTELNAIFFIWSEKVVCEVEEKVRDELSTTKGSELTEGTNEQD